VNSEKEQDLIFTQQTEGNIATTNRDSEHLLTGIKISRVLVDPVKPASFYIAIHLKSEKIRENISPSCSSPTHVNVLPTATLAHIGSVSITDTAKLVKATKHCSSPADHTPVLRLCMAIDLICLSITYVVNSSSPRELIIIFFQIQPCQSYFEGRLRS